MLNLNKRQFVLGTAAALGAPLAQATSASSTAADAMPSALRTALLPMLDVQADLQTWSSYIGQPFTLKDSGLTLTLKAVQATALDESLEQFAVRFALPAGSTALPSGLYELQHAKGHRVQLYLAQSVEADVHTGLRADFSRTLA